MNSNKKRILLVDDEKLITRLLKLNLEKTDRYIVHVENTGINAVAAAEAFHPDLILLDIMMPGMDGGDVAQNFQETEGLKDIPVVFLTAAVTRQELLSKGGTIGGLPFLAKPIEVPAVISHIEKYINKSVSPA